MPDTNRPLRPAGAPMDDAEMTPIPGSSPVPTALSPEADSDVETIRTEEVQIVRIALGEARNDTGTSPKDPHEEVARIGRIKTPAPVPYLAVVRTETAARSKPLRTSHNKLKGEPVKARGKQAKGPGRPPKVRELPTAKGSPLRQMMDKMVSEGIVPQGAHWLGVEVPKPLSIEETFAQLRALQQIDYYTVVRVLLQWKSPRFLKAEIIKSVVRLMKEQRMASVPNLLRTIAMNPADGGDTISSSAGQTVDGVQSETEADINDLLDGYVYEE